MITSRDGELSDMVMEAIGTNMDQYGIELLKFETKQLDLPDDNKEAVYERMISERDNIAATYKAEGNSEAKVIRNKTDKEVAIQIPMPKTGRDPGGGRGAGIYENSCAGLWRRGQK